MTDGIQEVAKEVGPAAQQVADQADSQVQQAAKQARNASLFRRNDNRHACDVPPMQVSIQQSCDPRSDLPVTMHDAAAPHC